MYQSERLQKKATRFSFILISNYFVEREQLHRKVICFHNQIPYTDVYNLPIVLKTVWFSFRVHDIIPCHSFVILTAIFFGSDLGFLP